MNLSHRSLSFSLSLYLVYLLWCIDLCTAKTLLLLQCTKNVGNVVASSPIVTIYQLRFGSVRCACYYFTGENSTQYHSCTIEINSTHSVECDTGAIYLSREYYLIIDKQEAFNHLKHLQFTSESDVPFSGWEKQRKRDLLRHLQYLYTEWCVWTYFTVFYCGRYTKYLLKVSHCIRFHVKSSILWFIRNRREMRKSIDFSKHSTKTKTNKTTAEKMLACT